MQYVFADHVLDVEQRQLRRGAETVALEPQVFDLLVYLIEKRDRVVSKDELLRSVWGGRIVSDSTLDSRISAARKAIADTGAEQILIRTMPRKGVRFVGAVVEQRGHVAAGSSTRTAAEAAGRGYRFADRPSIAVLPFANFTGDPEQEYLVDGITEDVIFALGRWRWFFVIARESTFIYKGKTVDARQVRREMGVRYVVTGIVREVEGRLRISIALVDAMTRNYLWADRFEFGKEDLSSILDDLTHRVAAAIEPAVKGCEIKHSRSQKVQEWCAWDHYFAGLWYLNQQTAAEAQSALGHFRQAVALDPNLAEAYVGLARAYHSEYVYCYSKDRKGSLRRAAEFAQKGLSCDGENCYAHYILALTAAHSGDPDTSIRYSNSALNLNPSFACAYFSLAIGNLYIGKPKETLTAIDTALRLSPRDPLTFAWLATRASALYLLRRYEDAVAAARQSHSLHWFHTPVRILAASYMQLGILDSAKAAVSELLDHPLSEKTISQAVAPFKRACDREHYATALRRAGLPE